MTDVAREPKLNFEESPRSPASNAMVLYRRFARITNQAQPFLLLFMRLYIGYQCVISGYAHLSNYQAMVHQFVTWHVPLPKISVGLSAITEIMGGALLFVGFASRLISIPLIFNFLVAMIQVDLADPDKHRALLDIWNDQSIIFADTAFPFFATVVLILFFGPGWVSIDGWLDRRHQKDKP